MSLLAERRVFPFSIFFIEPFDMLLIIAMITYTLAGAFALKGASISKTNYRSGILILTCLGLLAHTVSLAYNFIQTGTLQMSLLNSLSICVWMTVMIVTISGVIKPTHSLFLFFMPAGAFFLLIGLLAPQFATPKTYSGGLLIHIFTSLLAYSVVLITTLQATLVNFQNHQLHKKDLDHALLKLLPALQHMESLMFGWLRVGLILLSLAIIVGIIYVDNLFTQHLIHKTVLTVIAWVLFTVLLVGHHFFGWRGHRASQLIYLGSGSLLLAFVGSQFVLEYVLKVA